MGDNMLSSGDASRNVSQRGVKCFSLIELLVVIAMIAILAGMLLPALNTVRAKASQISCISNMKQVFQAQNEYMDSYNDWLPAGSIQVDGYIFSDKTVSDTIPGTSFLLYTGFIKSPMAAICPETIKAAGSGRIKKWCSDKAWSAVGNYMYAPVIYQYGNDHTGKSFTSAGYTRTAKFTQTVVLPYPRRSRNHPRICRILTQPINIVLRVQQCQCFRQTATCPEVCPIQTGAAIPSPTR